MNKKEQAAVADLEKQLSLALAFRRTPYVVKDVPVPSKGYSHGFDMNVYSQSVTEYWSGQVSHYTSNPEGKSGYVSGAQRGIELYSTRLLALKALRHAVENAAAKNLANIDALIAKEIEVTP